MKYLIVNADDLGMSSAINQGILQCYKNGIVTSTTAMVNLPHCREGIELIQSQAPQMGIGLHINLTYGSPLSPLEKIPNLVGEDENFYSASQLLKNYKNIPKLEIDIEIEAQWQCFLELAGTKPDHIDAHQFTASLLPQGLAKMIDLAINNHIPMRKPFYNKDLLQAFVEHRKTMGIYLEISQLEQLTCELEDIYSSASLPGEPDFFEFRFYHQEAQIENLANIVANLPDGVTEIMCHPGYKEHLPEFYQQYRQQEVDVLTNIEMREKIISSGIKLVNFSYFSIQCESDGKK